MSAPRLWTANFLLIAAVNFTVTLVFYMLLTTMALYAVDRFSASDPEAGFAASSFVASAIVSRLLAAKFIDLVGRRRSLILTLIMFAATALLYFGASTLAALITVRLIHGLIFGIVNTITATGAISLIPRSRRSEGLGHFSSSTTIATAFGPFLAVFLIDLWDYDALFLWVAISSVVGLVAAIPLRLPERTISAEEMATRWRMRLTDMLEPRALAIPAVLLPAAVAYAGVVTYLNSYTREEDLGLAGSSFFIAYAITVMASRLVIGRAQDVRGDNAVMYPILLSFTVGLALLSQANGMTLVILSGAFIGIGFGALLPAAHTIVVSRSPEHRVTVATSSFFLMINVGVGFGPVLLGFMLPHTGFRTMFLILSGLVLVSAVLYHVVHGRYGKEPLLSDAG